MIGALRMPLRNAHQIAREQNERKQQAALLLSLEQVVAELRERSLRPVDVRDINGALTVLEGVLQRIDDGDY